MIDLKLDHVGLVVPRLEPALEKLSSQLGFEWSQIYEPVLPMHRPGRGTQDVHLRVSLSLQVPRLEVIEALPDSVWVVAGNEAVLHHLAYYADDLPGDSSRLVAGACPIELCGVKPDGTMPTTFTYQHILAGFRIELLQDRTS